MLEDGGAVAQSSAVPVPLPTPLPAPLPAVLPREDRASLEALVAHLGRDSAQKLFSGNELECTPSPASDRLSPGRWCVLHSTVCVLTC